jgi:hypothetical protein
MTAAINTAPATLCITLTPEQVAFIVQNAQQQGVTVTPAPTPAPVAVPPSEEIIITEAELTERIRTFLDNPTNGLLMRTPGAIRTHLRTVHQITATEEEIIALCEQYTGVFIMRTRRSDGARLIMSRTAFEEI